MSAFVNIESDEVRVGRDLASLAALHRSAQWQRWRDRRPSAELIVRIYRRDVVISMPPDHDRPLFSLPGPGRQSRGLSRRTARRISFITSNMEQIWASMLTLTYPSFFPVVPRLVSMHRDLLFRTMRRRFGEFLFFWVWEHQERGAPHLHILLDFAPVGKVKHLERGRIGWEEAHNWVNEKWMQSIGPYATPEGNGVGATWEALQNPDSAARYLAPYLAKGGDANLQWFSLPPGAWWGRSMGMKDPEPDATYCIPACDWDYGMGRAATGRCGTRYSLVHDGRRKVLDAADVLDVLTGGATIGPDNPDDGPELPFPPGSVRGR